MRGLPEEFSGVRTPDEVLSDLRAIAGSVGTRSLVTAMAHAPGEDAITTAGSLRLHATSSEARIFVGDDCIAEFHPTALRGGWLRTLDGDDYFTLSIDTGANLITLQD